MSYHTETQTCTWSGLFAQTFYWTEPIWKVKSSEEPGKWKLCKLNCASPHILISPSEKQYGGGDVLVQRGVRHQPITW